MKKMRRKQGQAMVEYIIIVAVVAIAALTIFGFFGDVIQSKLGGSIKELDGDGSIGSQVDVNAGDSLQSLKELDGAE